MTAFIYLSKQYPNLHLLIIGNGPEYQYIKEQALKNGLQDKIHLAGVQPHNKIPDFLSAGDIFVLPSYNEGLPNAVLEAMACSRPVVATKVGGIPEAVRNGETGFLINEKDVGSLVNAINKLLSNEKLCTEMGLSGRKVIEQKFSWEYNAKEHIKIYEKLIQKN
jgi:glycosyltransferase involved in cell wall biosynthesis